MATIPEPKPINTTVFDDTDKKNLDGHLRNIQVALDQIKLAESAGLDVSEAKKSLLESRDKFLRLKQVYFPHG